MRKKKKKFDLTNMKQLVGSEQSFNLIVLDGLVLRSLLQLGRDKVL